MFHSKVHDLHVSPEAQKAHAQSVLVSVRRAASAEIGTPLACSKLDLSDQYSSSSRSVCTSFGMMGEQQHDRHAADDHHDRRQACRPALHLARHDAGVFQHSVDLHSGPTCMLSDLSKLSYSMAPVILQDDWIEQTWQQQQSPEQQVFQYHVSNTGVQHSLFPGMQSPVSQPASLQLSPPRMEGAYFTPSYGMTSGQQPANLHATMVIPENMSAVSGRNTITMSFNIEQDRIWEGAHRSCTEPQPLFQQNQSAQFQLQKPQQQLQLQRAKSQETQGMRVTQARCSLPGNVRTPSLSSKRTSEKDVRESSYVCKRRTSSISHMEEFDLMLQQRPASAFVKGAAAACVDLATSIALPSGRMLPAINRSAGISVKSEDTGKLRSSRFRGVTKHRRSGRWEAHIWVKEIGRQVYLGGYLSEEHAAEAYDVAALKCKGTRVKTNFEVERYTDLMTCMDHISLDELIMAVRRQSQGFSRGSSLYRGVSAHPSSRWESRIGVPGSKHIYLGLFEEERDAAAAYDRSLIRLRGSSAATNFGLSDYRPELAEYHQMQQAILLGDPRMQDVQNGPDFERWIKLGASAFPFIEAIIQAGAGACPQESDTTSYSPTPTMTTPSQQPSWLNLAQLRSDNPTSPFPVPAFSDTTQASMIFAPADIYFTPAAADPAFHSHPTSVNNTLSVHTHPLPFPERVSLQQGSGVQAGASEQHEMPRRMGLRTRPVPAIMQPPATPLTLIEASTSPGHMSSSIGSVMTFPEQPCTPPLSQLLTSWNDTAKFDFDFMHTTMNGGEVAGRVSPALGEAEDATSEQMMSSLLSELGGQGDGTTKDVWNW